MSQSDSYIPKPIAQQGADLSVAGDLRRLRYAHRRQIAFRFIDAWREVREETGYGAIEDAVAWANRVVEGRGQ